MNSKKLMKTKQIKKPQIAVFGGAFNPPTLGHLSLIKRLVHFDKILLVPSFHHAWGKLMAPFSLRCQWLNAFIIDSQLNNVLLCTEEENISQGGSVTTWILLNHLQQIYSDAALTFVLGPDNLLNFNKFDRYDEILTHWNILCCPLEINIRSTMIRNALEKGENIENMTTISLAQQLNFNDFNTE